MMERGAVYKPAVEYTAGTLETNKTSPLKEIFLTFLEKISIIALSAGIFLASAGIIYKSYVFLKLRSQRNFLKKENALLQKKFEKLTSLDTAIKKAKEFGLRFPEKKDFIYLRP